jgi:hypothetical protein
MELKLNYLLSYSPWLTIYFHAYNHDVATMLSQFVGNVGDTQLPIFPTKQHHLIGGIGFGQDWAY